MEKSCYTCANNRDWATAVRDVKPLSSHRVCRHYKTICDILAKRDGPARGFEPLKDMEQALSKHCTKYRELE